MPRTEARETTTALTIPKSTLGVGIVGVSPVRGWAATAHIPALRALPSYEIRALSAHNAESARAAGEAFGVSKVFSDHEQLVTQPDIDVVAVTVKGSRTIESSSPPHLPPARPCTANGRLAVTSTTRGRWRRSLTI